MAKKDAAKTPKAKATKPKPPAPPAAMPTPEPAPAPKRTGPGRPPLLTPKIQQDVVHALTTGNFVSTACLYAGIHKDTYYDWVKRGAAERNRRDAFGPLSQLKGKALEKEVARREAEEPYVKFSDAVKKAAAESQTGLVSAVFAAAMRTQDPEWRAAAWLLERMDPRQWGATRKVLVEVDTEVRAQLEATLGKLEEAVEAGDIDAATFKKILAIIGDLEEDGLAGGAGAGEAGGD